MKFTSISEAAVDASIQLVEQAKTPISDGRPLSAAERMRLPKIRRGAHQVLPTLAHLGAKYGLGLESMSIDEMLEKLSHAERLKRLQSAVLVLQKALADEILRAEADAWATGTVTYAVLRRAAKARPGDRSRDRPHRGVVPQGQQGPHRSQASEARRRHPAARVMP